MNAIDVSSVVGLIGMVLMTTNIALGLLVATNYKLPNWLHRRLPARLFQIHNWTGYIAICVVLLHPAILLFSSNPRFRLLDVLWPLNSPGQRLYNMLGAITLYSFALVVVTSYFRPKLRHRLWKKFHFVTYFAGLCMFSHGILVDPNLKNQPTDFLDGEKVLVEVCFLIAVSASIWRLKYGNEKQRWQAAKRRAFSDV